MTSPAASPRHTATLPRAHAPGRPARQHTSTPVPPDGTGRLAGRFRGDLATDQWWWSPELFALPGTPGGWVPPPIGLLLSHVPTSARPAAREALSPAGTAGIPVTREYRALRMDGQQRTALLVCEPE